MNAELFAKQLGVECRLASTDELHVWRETAAFDAVDPDPEFPGLVGRHIARVRLDAIDQEIGRRSILSKSQNRDSELSAPAWSALARELRSRIDLPKFLVQEGLPLTATKKHSRRGSPEFFGSCPLCGGTDRFRVWGGEQGRAWCRQCGISWDLIAAARSIWNVGFRDAVRRLASQEGVAVPGDFVPKKWTVRVG